MTARKRADSSEWVVTHTFENSTGIYRTVSCAYTIKDRGVGATGPRFICLTHACLEHNREHICDHVAFLRQLLAEDEHQSTTTGAAA